MADAIPSSSSKPSPTKQETDMTQEAVQLIVQGKRHLLVNDAPSAVNSLQEACLLLDSVYGGLANECGEAYFHYGRALLEVARIEAQVIDDPTLGENDEDNEKSSDDEEPAEENAAEDDEEDGEGEEEGEEEGKEPQESEQEDGEKNADEANSDQRESGSEDTGNEESISGDDKNDKEVSNLQLAWEMFELAKVVYKRQYEAEHVTQMGLKLADSFLKLGEVSIESENYSQAVEDLLECLELQKKLLPEPEINRKLAETHYQLGLAFGFADKFDDSVMHYKCSSDVISRRIDVLKTRLEKRQSWENLPAEEREKIPAPTSAEYEADPFYKEEEEIKDLESLLPELKEKAADSLSSKLEKERIHAQSNGASTSHQEMNGSSSSSLSRPVSNISHLVRKKRKADEPLEEESQAKKPCAE